MELFVDKAQQYTFLIQLIVSYLKLDKRNKVNIIYLSNGALKAIQNGILKIEAPTLITQEGEVITEIFQICYKLFQALPHLKPFFLGSTAEQENQIKTIKTNLKEGKQFKKHLQKFLQPKTFFVSSHLSFADLFMFTKLYDSVVEMTDQQKNQYNNIFRWFKHIQNLPQIRKYLQQSQRFIVEDPELKIPFLADKKKGKK